MDPKQARVATAEVAEALNPVHLLRRVAQLVVVVAVVGVAVVTLPGLGQLRQHIQQAEPGWLIAGAAAELASALSYIVVLRAVFCPCMSWRPSYQLGMSELAAASLLPAGGAGGLALGAWALQRGGMSIRHIARRTVTFFLLTSAANFGVVIVAGIGVALGLLPGRAGLYLTIVPALLAAAAVLVVLVLPRFLGGAASAPVSTSPQGFRARVRGLSAQACAATAEGVRETVSLVRSGRALAIAGALGYLAFDIAALAVCFRATGSLPPLGDFALAYTIGQLGALIPVPGGLGATDGGLIGAFVLYGGSLGPVTAAVLLYRLVQLGVPAVLGAPAFLLLRRRLRRPKGFASICEPLADDAAATAAGRA
jgi:uncharacterized membrane protein YbhN (UPF0104 family)